MASTLCVAVWALLCGGGAAAAARKSCERRRRARDHSRRGERGERETGEDPGAPWNDILLGAPIALRRR